MAKERGDSLFREERYEAAVEEYSRAIELEGSATTTTEAAAAQLTTAVERRASLLHNRAYALLRSGRLGEALADAEEAIRLTPSKKNVLMKVNVLKAQGRTADANVCYMRGGTSSTPPRLQPRPSATPIPPRPSLLGSRTTSSSGNATVTLRAPRPETVDREARSFERGNRPLIHLGAEGRMYIRGIGYTLVPRAEAGYIGGGTFGRVWRARRDLPPLAPLHDISGGDEATRLLNVANIAVKLFRCDGAAGEKGAASAADARREVEMHARAGCFVPGVITLLAVTPIAPDGGDGDDDDGGVDGEVFSSTSVGGPITVDPAWTEGVSQRHAASPAGARWVLMACELAGRGTLRSWVNRLDLRGCGVWTRAHDIAKENPELARRGLDGLVGVAGEDARGGTLIRGGSGVGRGGSGSGSGSPSPLASAAAAAAAAVTAEAEATELQERLACGLMLRLLRQVKQLHAHGVLHLDLKLDNIALDAKWGVRLIDFGLARTSDDPRLPRGSGGTPGFQDPSRGRSAASDVFSLGCVMHCLLAGARSVFQVAAWHAYFDSLIEPSFAELREGGARKGGRDTSGASVQEFFQDLQTQMARGNPFRPDGIPSEHAAHLLAQMLRRDPTQRWSIDQCLDHPWFTSVDDEAQFATVVERVTEALASDMQALADDASLSMRGELGVGSEGGERELGGGLLRVVFPPVAHSNGDVES